MSKAWAGGSTRRGRKVNAQVILRDDGLCQIRLPGTWTNRRDQTQRCLIQADCVHHTVGKGVTGDDPTYMVAACTPCNLKVGDPLARVSVGDPEPRRTTRW